MAPTPQTRKILWSQSGNCCARCDTQLVRPPEALGDAHAIVGRECHIVAQAEAGPRGTAGPRDDLDSYGNLILLCANCHAVIDGQQEAFPPEELRRIKAEHERKVAQRNAPGMPELRWRGRDKPLRLERVTSGDMLLSIVGTTLSFAYEAPTRMTREQRTLLGSFFQSCRDWAEAYGEIGPQGHFDGGQDLQDGLDAVHEEGLLVYGAVRQLVLTGGVGGESPWPEGYMKVVQQHDARVTPRETTRAP
jgi:hypothetical protein